MKYSENALKVYTTFYFINKKNYIGKVGKWIIENDIYKKGIDEIVGLINKKIDQINNDSKSKAKYNPQKLYTYITKDEFENKMKAFNQIFSEMSKYCDGLIAYGDEEFPRKSKLSDIDNPPIFLFYKGDINLLSDDNKKITIIGVLNPDKDIKEREKKIVEEIVKQNVVVVSGLAFGCDTVAHEHTLDKNGKTIAILPGPLQKIIPASNKSLAERIVEKGGLLVTEYAQNIEKKYDLIARLIERDRLQALFADAVILIASYSKGSEKICID